MPTDHVERIDARPDGSFDRYPEYDPRTGDHFWVMALTFRVDPKAMVEMTPGVMGPILDHESMTGATPIFCWHCEEAYTARLYHRRCPGHPKPHR